MNINVGGFNQRRDLLKMFHFLGAVALGFGIASACSAQLVNGDFSAGNTGFTSGYTYSSGSDPGPGNYTLNTSPKLFNAGAAAFGDHTTGTGLMLIADGSQTASVNVWSQTISLTPNTSYHFSAYATSWGQLGNGIDPSPSTLVFLRDGVQAGTLALSAQNGQWSNFGFDFNSGASTSSVFAIRDSNTVFVGNDFALDDLSVALLPEPQAASLIIPFGLMLMMRRKPKSVFAAEM